MKRRTLPVFPATTHPHADLCRGCHTHRPTHRSRTANYAHMERIDSRQSTFDCEGEDNEALLETAEADRDGLPRRPGHMPKSATAPDPHACLPVYSTIHR